MDRDRMLVVAGLVVVMIAGVAVAVLIVRPRLLLWWLGISLAIGVALGGWIVTWDERNRRHEWPKKDDPR